MTSSASNLVRGHEIVRNAERRRDALPSIVVFVALVGLAFETGGFFPRAWTTASVALLWVAALVLLLAARVELSSPERMWIGLLAGLLAWTALSTAWSVNHTESVLDARRDLLYLAAVVTVLLLATRQFLFALFEPFDDFRRIEDQREEFLKLLRVHALAEQLFHDGP